MLEYLLQIWEQWIISFFHYCHDKHPITDTIFSAVPADVITNVVILVGVDPMCPSQKYFSHSRLVYSIILMVILWLFEASKSWLNISQKWCLSIVKPDFVSLLFSHVRIMRLSSDSVVFAEVGVDYLDLVTGWAELW